MASDKTPKLGLNVFAETDIVDFGEINENSVILDNALNWRLVDPEHAYYTGSQGTAIALPSNFSEISIKVNIDKRNIICVLNICIEEIYPADTGTTQSFRTGYYLNSDNGGCADFGLTQSSVNLNIAWLNGGQVTSNTTWSVFDI